MEKINEDKHLYRLKGVVQHYDWGGDRFIPQVTGIRPDGRPMAEYWLGAHPSAPSVLSSNGEECRLDAWIAGDPQRFLGAAVAKRFGRLPYLLKLLDVKDMLSIQVHPSKKQAEIEFRRENEAGVPLDARWRNYRDDNHKPELMVAMSEFWLLHGFKPAVALRERLQSVPELEFLLPLFEKGSYEAVYRTVMEMPVQEVNDRLKPLVKRILPLYVEEKIQRSSEDFWAARAALNFANNGQYDRGIFSIYLFNLVKLEEGEGVFQDAGVPHAYLEGWNVEIMANSDNVLRGGLTTKHIDVKELLKHTRCEPTEVIIDRGIVRGSGHIYPTPAPDFELSSLRLKKGEEMTLDPSTADILLLLSGRVRLAGKNEIIALAAGQPAAVIFPGEEISISAEEDCLLFRATVPSQQ